MTAAWSQPTSPQNAYRRAGGRKHYNRMRQNAALRRRARIIKYLRRRGTFFDRRLRRVLAAKLGVSYSTICRDIKEILKENRPCECCGALAVRLPGIEE